MWSRDDVMSIVIGYRQNGQGIRIRFAAEITIFPFSTSSRLAVGPTQLPIRWVSSVTFRGDKAAGHEANHSPPFSTEVKNGEAIPPPSHMCSQHTAYLIKHREYFTFHLF
jgi:hypothetical protein